MSETFFSKVYNYYRGNYEGSLHETYKDGDFECEYWLEKPSKWDNEDTRGVIRIKFNSIDDCLETLFDFDDTDSWVIKSAWWYNDTNYTDYSSIESEFREGHFPYDILDDDNKERFSEIGNYFGLKYKDDTEFFASLFEVLDNYNDFDERIDSMAIDYSHYMDFTIRDTIREKSEKDFDEDFFIPNGFKVNETLEKYSIGVIELLKYMIENKITDAENIIEVIEHMKKNTPLSFENYENYHEWGYSHEFSDEKKKSFNFDVKYELEKIIKKLDEDGIPFDSSFFIKIRKLYSFKETYSTPKNENIKFIIKGIEIKQNKVLIQVNRGKGWSDTYAMGEDEFFNFLYHPELF